MQRKFSIATALVAIFSLVIVTLGCIVLYNRKNPCVIIVNNPGAGRFGDQIVGYSKAKYLSWKYNIPFRLIPFQYSECLKMSEETCYTSWWYFLHRVFYKLFCRVVWVHTEQDLIDALEYIDGPTRFIAHINTRLNEHIKAQAGLDRYECSWVGSLMYELSVNYPVFGAELKKMLQPITPFHHAVLPKDAVTVAVHIRKGGGFHADPVMIAEQYFSDYSDKVAYKKIHVSQENNHLLDDALTNIPTFDYDLKSRGAADEIYADKFPPEQYYVDQIRNLSAFFDDAAMYVYIFTDDQDPHGLMERIKQNVGKHNVTYATRTTKNSHDSNVLYDWFFIADFDCLIRSGSLFPYTAQLVGNHKVVIYPLHLKWINDRILLVDKVGVAIRDREFFGKRFGSIE